MHQPGSSFLIIFLACLIAQAYQLTSYRCWCSDKLLDPDHWGTTYTCI